MLYVITLICSQSIPIAECNTKTARAYDTRATNHWLCDQLHQGGFMSLPLAFDEKEYILTKCRTKK